MLLCIGAACQAVSIDKLEKKGGGGGGGGKRGGCWVEWGGVGGGELAVHGGIENQPASQFCACSGHMCNACGYYGYCLSWMSLDTSDSFCMSDAT